MVRRVFIVSLSFFLVLFPSFFFFFFFFFFFGRRDMIGSIDFCFPKRHASLMGITKKKFKKKRWKRRRIALLFFDERVLNRAPFLFFV